MLSFTSMPSPYRRLDRSGGTDTTLLSRCSYRRTDGQLASPPPKPLRTYTHCLNKQTNKPNKQLENTQTPRQTNTKDDVIPNKNNNNTKQLVSKFTNYVPAKQRSESFRNIVNLKLHSDMFTFFTKQKGKYKTANDNFKHLPYLQTRV